MAGNYDIGARLYAFLLNRFGTVSAAAAAFGVKSASLYSYMDPKGRKEAAGQPIHLPGPSMLSKLAASGCDLHWLITGELAPTPNSEGKNSVPSGEAAESDQPRQKKKEIDPEEAAEMLALLSILGIDSTERLRKFLDPETLIKDIVACYLARLHPPTGQ